MRMPNLAIESTQTMKPQNSTVSVRPVLLTEMEMIESSTCNEAWIIAEDRVVDYLVRNHLSGVTVNNICRGVNYRFLVAEAKLEEMQDFAADTCRALLNTSKGLCRSGLGRIDVHAIPSDQLNLAMPGCLFDPNDLAKGRSYFRTCYEVKKKTVFVWIELSSTHHTQYLEGFKAVWPPSRDELRKSIHFLGMLSVLSGTLISFAAASCCWALSLEPNREAAWATMLGGTAWMMIIWGLAWHPRSVLVRRTRSFAVFEGMLGIVCAGLVLGVLVNILSDWLLR